MWKVNMDDLARKMISGTYEEFCEAIVMFTEIYGDKTKFEELNNNNLRDDLWKALYRHLTNFDHSSVHHYCLSTLRVLSREKTNLEQLITDELIDAILQNAGLVKICEVQETPYSNVTIESLKLLCNLLFNCVKVQQSPAVISSLSYLFERISKYNSGTPHEIKLFDIRILFLITALNVPMRTVVKTEHNGDIHLIKILNDLCGMYGQGTAVVPKDDEITLVCEVLKVLFNLYIQADDTAVEDQEKNKNLVMTLKKLLINVNCNKQDELHSNIINLLTVIPYSCYSPLIEPIQSDNCKDVYQDMDMTAISVLLKFLDQRLNLKTELIENISPVITALVRLVKTERLIRKYVRLQVLPPLKDVMKRPEEGTTLRAKLCQLLTSPLTELRDLVAEFLFVLCKENVSRMVKYTGYGNAAGMFANKGLLGRKQTEAPHSSESDDSETEEYLKYKELINPVTGCFEKPKPNPLEGMSEEQKEYEALQLVGLVDKLQREGIVQPCRIGEDGKPKPIEHVLELQEELPKQQFIRRDSDSD